MLKDILRIRGIWIWSNLLFVCTAFFTEMGKDLAFHRTLGFLVFFLIGYSLREKGFPDRLRKLERTPVIVAVVIIVAQLFIFTRLVSNGHYETIVDIFCHRILFTDYPSWYLAPLLYLAAMLLIFVNSVCFMALARRAGDLAEKVGQDTMPLYITHLLVYLAIIRLSAHFNMPKLVYVISGILAIIATIIVCSVKHYREIFHKIVDMCISFISRKPTEGIIK